MTFRSIGITTALMVLLLASHEGCTDEVPHSTTQPNVLLVTLDTVRADHLPIHGYEGVKTPNMDRLAADGVVFNNAIAPTPLTLPSHTSILTGTYPLFHGVRNNGDFHAAPELTTAAEMFKSAGYSTAAFVGAYVLDSRFGLDQGFDLYDDDMVDGRQVPSNFMFKDRRAGNVVRRVREWLDQWEADAAANKPFFLWVHLYDPHAEYEPPEPYRTRFADNLYDGEIAYTDSELGVLFDTLKARGIYDDTLVALTADHGESLGEHGERTHSVFIYNATTWVPLVVKLPGSEHAGERVDATVSIIDILPTVIDAVDLEGRIGEGPGRDIQGISLVPLMEGAAADPGRLVYSESYLPFYYHNWAPPVSVRNGELRYIDLPEAELYDMREDPAELTNLHEQRRSEAAEIREGLEALRKRHSRGEMAESRREMDPETRAKLMALGYIQGEADTGGSKEAADRPDPKTMIHVTEALEQARALINADDHDAAEARLSAILAEDPANLRARHLYANTLKRLGRMDRAIEEYEALKAADPEFLAAYLGLCTIFTKERIDYARAEQELEGAFAVASWDPTPWIIKGDLEQERGEVEASVTSYRKAQEMGDQSVSLFVGLGSALQMLDRLEEARAVLEKAIYIDGESGPAHYNLGIVLSRLGEKALAKRYYRLSILHDPDNPRTYTNLGSILVGEKAYAEAEGLFREALRVKPDHLEAVYNLGTVYMHLDRPLDAVPPLQRAIELGPDLVVAYNNLVAAYQRLGRQGAAFETYKRLAAVRPDLPGPWYNMARIAATQGKKEAARDYLGQAIRKGGEDIRARAAKEPAFRGIEF